MIRVWLAPMMAVVPAVVGAVVGGLLVHKLTMTRELLVARRARRTDYLISAYRQLIDAANRESGLSKEQIDSLEVALGDIMLLGEAEEVAAARIFIIGMAQNGSAELDPLIRTLRASLRRELALDEVGLPSPYNLRIELDQVSDRADLDVVAIES